MAASIPEKQPTAASIAPIPLRRDGALLRSEARGRGGASAIRRCYFRVSVRADTPSRRRWWVTLADDKESKGVLEKRRTGQAQDSPGTFRAGLLDPFALGRPEGINRRSSPVVVARVVAVVVVPVVVPTVVVPV